MEQRGTVDSAGFVLVLASVIRLAFVLVILSKVRYVDSKDDKAPCERNRPNIKMTHSFQPVYSGHHTQ